MKKIYLPLKTEQIENLNCGEKVLLNGIIYTARDRAHQKMVSEGIPFDIKGQVIYYCGPTPSPPDKIIGSCGPTTSSRMDKYTIFLLKSGLKGMIGKGSRSNEVKEAIKKYKAIYFIAFGGCGALYSEKIKKADVVAYPELGPEAIYCLEVVDFPVIVGIDVRGNDIYRRGLVFSH